MVWHNIIHSIWQWESRPMGLTTSTWQFYVYISIRSYFFPPLHLYRTAALVRLIFPTFAPGTRPTWNAATLPTPATLEVREDASRHFPLFVVWLFLGGKKSIKNRANVRFSIMQLELAPPPFRACHVRSWACTREARFSWRVSISMTAATTLTMELALCRTFETSATANKLNDPSRSHFLNDSCWQYTCA